MANGDKWKEGPKYAIFAVMSFSDSPKNKLQLDRM